ncbi:ankyrin repeat domain-containing protein 60-like [Dendronephthya gigantea]|uniref:ankyrin repeat domain-containing protein 60-like n=1 Tax=Dendronephthya gigantea TaxID=151771 RepID=UPI00106A0CFB|nr:ankyrin repeat domain-containing protein 60-like [Dendronephthya gigantea]
MAKIKKKGNGTNKSTVFDIYLNIEVTRERFTIHKVTGDTQIKDLKTHVELVAGIPYTLQRLHYLDKTDMVDMSDLKHNDIVSGATIDLKLWKMWENVVSVIVRGRLPEILALGLTLDKSWEKLDKAFYKHKVETAKEKLQVALLLAAHRNNTELLKALLDLGADINYKTSMGRTALHMAASQGNSECIDMMLERGACIEVFDAEGKTPVDTANSWGKKDSERHLFLYQWQTRAAKVNPKKDLPLMMHQRFDSTLPTWLKGGYGQIYHASTLPAGEFSGTKLSSPPRKPTRGKSSYTENGRQNKANSVQGHTLFGTPEDDTDHDHQEGQDAFHESKKIVRENSIFSTDTTITRLPQHGNQTSLYGNDGSRYCKGGYYINSMIRAANSPARKSVYSAASSGNMSVKTRRKR